MVRDAHEGREALRVILDPRSIAVIGASENPHKIGGRPLLYLSKFGYRGKVYPINPKRSEAQGFRAYADVQSLPEVPEAAVIAVPGDLALAAVDECAQAGVKVVIVMTSGFGETGTEDGLRKQRQMAERARAAGMRLIGPNSQGLANFGSGAVLSFSTMFLETEPLDGPVGIVSQSGGMSVVPYGLLRARGIGVRHVHATGNDSEVTVPELAAVVAQDPQLELLLLYLESIQDAQALAQAAGIARERGLPVIALKSGRTAAGQEAARSHTGALANEDRVVDAFFEKHGIWRARDMNELVNGAELYLKGWRPGGRRLVAISNSGAVCVMAADAASAVGMPMATLADSTRAELGRVLPSFATTTNPIDITAALLSNSGLFSDILPVLARDPAADAFLIGIPVAGQGYDVEAFARDSAAFAQQTGKPLVVAAPQPHIAQRFKAHGLPVFVTESEAVAALHQFLSHQSLMLAARDAVLPAAPLAADSVVQLLNEADSLALLARHGVPVIEHRLCRDIEQVRAAIAILGLPLAVKGCSAEVVHKSELDLVRLHLRTPEEVEAAYRDVAQRLRDAGVREDGVILAKMARGRRELMIGARIDPVFGAVVVVGDGGKYVEAMPDVQLLLPPFSAAEVERALSRLRIAPLLKGVRGEPALDVAAVCVAVRAVGDLLQEGSPSVTNLDINPLIVGAAGRGCVAVDAVVYVQH